MNLNNLNTYAKEFTEFKHLLYDGSPKEGSPRASRSRTTMSWSQDLQEREALQHGMVVSTEHDDEVIAEYEAQAHPQELHYMHQDNPPQHPLAPPHHLPPSHPLPCLAADKTFSPPPSDHIQQNPHLHTRHNHALVSDQPPGRSNPSATVSPLQLSSGPCASESLEHLDFDPPFLSER